ncbi:MAG: hypothetical protein JW802_05565 [Campylobacterales bacterium]|nr:hypothetical protein [Campylobacterales bacterium]MBN2832583.1 hypothetical protein [Campylobacterales bacterium]
MLKQIIGGRTVKTVHAEMSEADLTALTPLLEGKIETYEKKFEGGTATTVPAVMNYIRFSVGKKVSKNVSISGSVTVPHIKSGKSFSDCKALVVGAFDSSFDSDVKCEYSNLIGSNSEVA